MSPMALYFIPSFLDHRILTLSSQLWDLMKVALYEGLVSKDSPAEELRAGTIMAFQDRLVACCINIWKSVKDTLCHDSPEGNGPDGSGDVDVKGILSYSFRACHESRYGNCVMIIWYFMSNLYLVNSYRHFYARWMSNCLMGHLFLHLTCSNNSET